MPTHYIDHTGRGPGRKGMADATRDTAGAKSRRRVLLGGRRPRAPARAALRRLSAPAAPAAADVPTLRLAGASDRGGAVARHGVLLAVVAPSQRRRPRAADRRPGRVDRRR